MENETLTDEELSHQGEEGDEAAFAALYERHFQRIYDFVLRLTRDHDEAADVTQSTFLAAYQTLDRRDPVDSVMSWLFTIAYHDALERLRRRRRFVPAGEVDDEEGLAALDPERLSDPLTEEERLDIGRVVWLAARALKPRDYALLDLYVRQGMDAAELARVTGVRREAVHSTLGSLRTEFEEAFTTLVLVLRGRSECEELAGLAGSQPLSARLQSKVVSHLRVCETCQQSRRRYVTAVELLGAVPPVAVLPALQESILSQVLSQGAIPESAEAPPIPAHGRFSWPSFDLWERLPMSWRLGAGAGAAVIGVLALVSAIAAGTVLDDGGTSTHDPDDVHSTSHKVGEPSAESIVTITWQPMEGILGYSVLWSEDESELPDTVRDLPATADSAWARLAEGDWYFSLRTQGDGGEWTSTVHLGPFMIRPGVGGTTTPTATASPTATGTVKATPAPTRRRPPPTQPPAQDTPIVISPPTSTPVPPPTQPPPPPTNTPVPPTATDEPPPTEAPTP
jgi:RNA polymerase sigma factor (sigma-70 family)